MKITKQPARLSTPAVQWCALLAAAYSLLIFTLPANRATMHAYHLSPFEYRIILFAIAVPSMLVWFAAFWGYATLHKYAHSIGTTPEGKHFGQLARGATWLAWSLPVPALVSLVLNAFTNHWPDFHPTAVIVINYLALLLPLIAYSIIGNATRGLLTDAKLKFSLGGARLIMFIFLAAGVLYCYATFRHFDLTSLGATNNPYFLPIWLMVLTVTVPYLYAWFVGLLGAYEMSLYSKNVQGVLYRRAFNYLSIGLIAVITSSVALQYIGGIQPRIGHLVFDARLVITLLFRMVGGGGFLLLALGAKRLKKIEEV